MPPDPYPRVPPDPPSRRLELLEDRTVPDGTPSLNLAISPSALWRISGPGAAVGTVTRTNSTSPSRSRLPRQRDTTEVDRPVVGHHPGRAGHRHVPDQRRRRHARGRHPVGHHHRPASDPRRADRADHLRHHLGQRRVGRERHPAGAVAVQADGKLVAAGTATGSRHQQLRLLVARYNANGIGSTPPSGSRTGAVAHRHQPGRTTPRGRSPSSPTGRSSSSAVGNGPNFDMVAVRFNANGTLDTTFGTGGKVDIVQLGVATTSSGTWPSKPDGKIVVSGNKDIGLTRRRLVRGRPAEPDGTLDTTFGTGGIVTTTFGSTLTGRAFGVAFQPDGQDRAAGTTAAGTRHDDLRRRPVQPGRHARTATFGTGGLVQTDVHGPLRRRATTSSSRTARSSSPG